MDYGLTGKRALVLGGSRGLGAACAAMLAAEGAEVTGASRSGGAPDGITGIALDLASEDSVARLTDWLKDHPVDILVNNCGGPAAGPARGQTPDAWARAFDQMAAAMFRITDAALPGMEAKGWGRVVTIGSSGVEAPIPGLAVSNAVRGAVAGWSKTLAAEVAALGITVNMVLPGRIATDRTAQLDAGKAAKQGKTVAEIESASRATMPIGRYGRPEEFASAVTFLCSAGASYVTGSMVRVDGGLIRSL